MELFETGGGKFAPLAYRISPKHIGDVAGQEHLLSEGKVLHRIITGDRLSSMILYGPPGCGKTVIARVIASQTKSEYERLNAVTAGVGDIREISKKAKERQNLYGRRTVLFIDEIHRFNKSQQDALLPDIEDGTLIFIGATTNNPYYYINQPLLSRCHIFKLNPLSGGALKTIIKRALSHPEGYAGSGIEISDDALDYITRISGGDARRALNILEMAVESSVPSAGGAVLTEESIKRTSASVTIPFDRQGDYHYDIISAFIKSMRGSDVDASLYWLARLIVAGEDPLFIARRIAIFSAEDVGCADPQAIQVAASALSILEHIGMPEGQIPLAMAVIYNASAPKSNTAVTGLALAREEIEKNGPLPVLPHLVEPEYKSAGEKKIRSGYLYPHDFPDHFVKQDYLGRPLKFYTPSGSGYEKKIAEFLKQLKKED